MAQPIGALRAELSASIAQFQSDMGKAANVMEKFATKTEKIANRINNAGRAMAIGITAPILAIGITAAKSAMQFEASMNRVGAAAQATKAQLAALEAQARAIGKDKTMAATAYEASQAMEALIKNGLSVEDVLNGAAVATVKLATATGGELEPSANLTADVMKQFGIQVGEVGTVVDKITGALIASKYGFDDYRLAIGQVGGFAAGVGVSFDDLNTALAATAAYFGSGSDAGTSFKNFLSRLVPQSKAAERTMKALGISFYDAQGNMKSMADIAQVLQDKVAGLDKESQNKVLYDIFGADSMRTAIALMEKGAKGFEEVRKQINGITADNQGAARMAGLTGSIKNLQKAVEALWLKMKDAGLLDFIGKVIDGITAMITKFSELPGPVLNVIGVVAGLAAAIGPLLVVIGTVMGALANLAPLLPMLGSAFAAVATFLLGPWGIAIAAAVAAVVLFKDQIGAALTKLWDVLQKVLGPPVQRLLAAFAKLWTDLTTGPLGDLLATAVQQLGDFLGALLEIGGTVVIQAIATVIDKIEALVSMITAVVDFVNALMTGDWQAAWSAMKDFATAELNLLIGSLDAFIPGLRKWCADCVDAMFNIFAAGFTESLRWVEATFPGFTKGWMDTVNSIITWAENMYTRFKPWIDGMVDLVMALINPIYMAQKAMDALTGKKTAGAPPQKPKAAAPPKAKPAAAGLTPPAPTGGTHFNSPESGGDAARNKVLKATKKFSDQMRKLGQQAAQGLDELTQPKSITAANALLNTLDNYIESAKEAGVDTKAFASQISAFRAQVEKLKLEGLAKEAEAFRLAVMKSGRAVDEYAKGGLTPLEAKLQDVDNAYESLRDKIKDQIEQNAVLADSNDAAAEAMKNLKAQLSALDAAHQSATDAANAQYLAEKKIADLQNESGLQGQRQAIEDAKRARGDNGPRTDQQSNMAALERDLQGQRQDSLVRQAELEAQIAEATRVGDTDRLVRLEQQKALEEELYGIVSNTTATQIDAATKLQEMYATFTADLSSNLESMIMNWKGDLGALLGIFKQLASSMFIKPGTDAIAGVVGDWMKGFDGFFAGGGTIQPGHWGFAGEAGIERITAGSSPVNITSNRDLMAGAGGGKTANVYISTPDANSFRMGKRQIARQVKDLLQ